MTSFFSTAAQGDSNVNVEDLNIFIVDDDESILRSVKRLMRSVGYSKTEVFDSAEDFLSRAHPESPCLLIVDLLLPGMGGIELCRHLRQAGHAVPTVFISALEKELERARTECPEGLAFLQKPFEQGDLVNAVRASRVS